jgi:hypothetical protein
MADNNFKGGPGGRLKEEEKKNTLYVSNPNDPRLRMYQDSLTANMPAKIQEDFVVKLESLPNAKKSAFYSSNRQKSVNLMNKIDNKAYMAAQRLSKENRTPYKIGVGGGWLIDSSRPPVNAGGPYTYHPILQTPKRPVVLVNRPKSEPIEPIQPRQSPVPQLAQPQMIAPVMRPVSVPPTTPMEEPMMEEEVVTERPVVRKPPRAVMPTRQGGWGNQPLLMKLFPKIYER